MDPNCDIEGPSVSKKRKTRCRSGKENANEPAAEPKEA
jgi:hypothetical protein